MFSIYITWRADEDEFFVTRLDLEQEQLSKLTTEQYVEMACDAEYPERPNRITAGESYELVSIVHSKNGEPLEFIL